VIKDGALQSKPWWAPRIVPPKDAPNVLLIITDDSGFGVTSTFGGIIPTPTMDRLAKSGLRYKPPFTLTAKLNKLTLKVNRPKLTPEQIKTLEAVMKKVEAGKE
jgi:hypothetical protein